MANTKKEEEKDPGVAIGSAIGRSEAWIQRNMKMLVTALLVVSLAVGGYYAYLYLYKAPQQEKAATAMYQAQEAFADDLIPVALNGDGNTIGFLQIIDKYSGTESGNLARHYAGQCYLKQGDFNNAIRYFGEYKSVKGSVPALLINAINAGLAGDAYVELGDLQKGVAQYEKAVKESDDVLTAPYYSRKAGDIYAELGNYAKALEMYTVVKVRYPASMEAREIEKAIGALEQKL